MKNIFFVICFLLSAGLAVANDNLLLMEEANKSYSENNFEQAIELYEKVIDNGMESPALYFNLGNAYFKINEIPSAILYYEKARKLKPYDEDILFNLAIANSRIVDKIETVPDIFYVKWWKNLVYTLAVDEWALASLISFSLVCTMLLIFLLTNVVWIKKTSFWLGLIMVLISATTYLMAGQKYNTFTKDHQAIVFTPTIAVKSSPSESGIDLFVIHEGSKISILDNVGEWYKIEIANGSVGWLKEKDFKKI